MKLQLADDGLREDLISNDDLRAQSDELLNALVDNLKDENVDNPPSEPVIDTPISIDRAKQGFSPREKGDLCF